MNEIICIRQGCTFRVHDGYFHAKRRFTAGICPVCNGPVAVVEAGTDNVVPGLTFARERSLANYGSVIPV